MIAAVFIYRTDMESDGFYHPIGTVLFNIHWVIKDLLGTLSATRRR